MASASSGKVTDEQKQMAQMCHYAALAGLVACGLGMPLGPLLVWRAKRRLGPFVDAQGKEALNFQITCWLAIVVTYAIAAGLMAVSDYFFALPVLMMLFAAAMACVAGTRAGAGEMYRYPLSVRLIR